MKTIPLTPENIEQINKDFAEHKEHVRAITGKDPDSNSELFVSFIKPPSFEEMFGYDIILLEGGGTKVEITNERKIENGKFEFKTVLWKNRR